MAKSGQPVPKLVWFYFDGTDVIVYTEPGAAKVRHIRAHPQVSLNLDSDGNGAASSSSAAPPRWTPRMPIPATTVRTGPNTLIWQSNSA